MSEKKREYETLNDYAVSVQGNEVIVMIPIMGRLSKEKALRTAAWLVCLADFLDPIEVRWEDVLKAVQNT